MVQTSNPLLVPWPMPGNLGGFRSFSAFAEWAEWQAFVLDLSLLRTSRIASRPNSSEARYGKRPTTGNRWVASEDACCIVALWLASPRLSTRRSP